MITNDTLPVVTGSLVQGQTLATSTGTWTSDDPLTFAYQWRRCDAVGANCVDIAGATGASYKLTAADVGSTIKARVTATEVPVPPPPPPGGLRFALGCDADQTKSATIGKNLGVHLMRTIDQSPSNSVSQIQSLCAIYQSRQIRPYILCNWNDAVTLFGGLLPGNLAAWAAAVGPGGTFYGANPSYASYAVTHIEMGNEWFYSYRGGPTQARAQDYAKAFKATSLAVKAANPNVNLLFMIDVDNRGATDLNNLVDYFYQGVSNIDDYIDGYSIHTYGPPGASNTNSKVTTLLSRMESHGASSSIPIWVTEDGISSDNGPSLSPNNYNWPTGMTYNEAGQGLRDKFQYMRTHPTFGDRLEVWTNYQAFDQQVHGHDTLRESYFGAVQNNGTSTKGDMTQSVIDHAAAYPGP